MTTFTPSSGSRTEPSFEVEVVDDTYDGPPISRIVLRNGLGMEATVFSRGCLLQKLIVPDRDGLLADVTLGYDTIEEYATDTNYFGAVVGRYANRIADGRFEIDGKHYQLARNNGKHHLHGGPTGFHSREWSATPFRATEGVGVRLTRTSADGEEGFPGELDVTVTYLLNVSGELICDYAAIAGAPTPVNIAQHAYWNLAGHDVGDVLDHELTVGASHFLPVDRGLIPLGPIQPVQGTGLDFREPRTIGERIDDHEDQLRIAHGYDHNFVLDRTGEEGLAFAARLHEPASGRVLEVFTTEPGLQVYAGNMIPRDLPGKSGARYRRHSGIALETQKFPDSPNHPEYPSSIASPEVPYRSRTVFRFSVQR